MPRHAQMTGARPGNFVAIVLLGTALLAIPAAARDVDKLWARRFADHLPEWCKYTMELPDESRGAYGDPAGAPYVAQFGEPFQHLHHYCKGMSWLYEASRVVDNVGRRRTYYADVVKECDYVLDRTDDTFALRPEIHVTKGIALMSLGLRLDAVESFTAALVERPDHVPAYLALSRYFESAGDRSEAIRVVREGLVRAPSASALQQRLAELERSDVGDDVAKDSR